MDGGPSRKDFHGRDNEGTCLDYFYLTACCDDKNIRVGFREELQLFPPFYLISILGIV